MDGLSGPLMLQVNVHVPPGNDPDMQTDDLRPELERHHSAAFGWAMHCCGRDRAEAEDVLQMSYLKILEGRAVFGGRSSFKTWLLGVVRRTASERRRWAGLRLFSARSRLDLLETPAQGGDPEAGFARSEAVLRLTQALRGCPSGSATSCIWSFIRTSPSSRPRA